MIGQQQREGAGPAEEGEAERRDVVAHRPADDRVAGPQQQHDREHRIDAAAG
jgi:hypothetical protein